MASVRKFIRHPSDIPIKVSYSADKDSSEAKKDQQDTSKINNVSLGGLAFFSPIAFEPQQIVAITIPCLTQHLCLEGIVLWCHRIANGYEIGIKFDDPNMTFQLRMIEQICHIEHYRKEVKRLEGRHLTSQQAAAEWINKYAADFPSFDDVRH